MRVVVFLGPTLPLGEARQVLDAIYLPPARQADLLSTLMTYRPDVIGLIDGEFEQSLSVWHKEIMYALHRGVRVYGASSMGALRAAETADFGMIGIGQIYEQFYCGELTEDDEVALAHGPAESGYRRLSEPMVNVRSTLQLALERAVIKPADHDRLVAIAKAIYFPQRTFPLIFGRAEADGMDTQVLERVRAFVADNYVDVKRADALALLRTLRDLPEDAPPPQSPRFADSYLFQTLYNRDRTVRHDDTDVPLATIANYVAVHDPDFPLLNVHALNRALVLVLAHVLEMTVIDDEVAQEACRLRVRLGLGEDDRFCEWLAGNDLSVEEFDGLMRENALCRSLHRWLMTQRFLDRSTRPLLDELRLEGRYTEWAERAAFQAKVLQVHHPDFGRQDLLRISLKALIRDHQEQTGVRLDTDVATWADDAGFHSVENLSIELLRARLAREMVDRVSAQLFSMLPESAMESATQRLSPEEFRPGPAEPSQRKPITGCSGSSDRHSGRS